MNVHQLLSGAGPHDAITNEALAFRSYFKRWGWGGVDYGARLAPGLNGSISPWNRLNVSRDDVLLIHHSAGFPHLSEVLHRPNPKLLLYHNITPARWLWEDAPFVAAQCAIGYAQLPEIVSAVDLVAADSEFNADELRRLGARDASVVPLLVDLDRLGAPASDGNDHSPTILFVGRLSPHKRQDEVIRCFALYRRQHAPGARLVLVGDPITPQYADYLHQLAAAEAPGAVSIESALSPHELGDRYRAADVFLCLSEHEGFCIPMLEAFHFGVPVVARPTGAIPGTVGNAALLVEDLDRGVVAELVHLAVTDPELRRELRHRAATRLEAFAPEAVTARLREAVERAADASPAAARG